MKSRRPKLAAAKVRVPIDPPHAHEALRQLELPVGEILPIEAIGTFTPQGRPTGLVATYPDGLTYRITLTKAGCSITTSFTHRFRVKVAGEAVGD